MLEQTVARGRVSDSALYQIACALDAHLEPGGPDAPDEALVLKSRELVREVVAAGNAHPMHWELTRLIGGTVTLRQLWEEALNDPTLAPDIDG